MTFDTAPIRLLTWNIHAGIGPDGRYDLDRIIALIRRHAPDIIALQEVDSRGRDATSPFALLATALGSHAAEARTIVAPDGHYGHLLISRWPLSATRLHDLSLLGEEPRCAIETIVSTPGAALHVTAVHLGLKLSERRRQAEMLARIANSPAETSVMLGDFNDWTWRGAVRKGLAQVLPARTPQRTFPARWPLLTLDRVYCRPHAALIRSWADPDGRHASDHLPLIAEIRLAPILQAPPDPPIGTDDLPENRPIRASRSRQEL
ncbi:MULTISPECIES: endonuclease/exonuclease/phosphatase family protein [Inquilinus]|uniref:Endonuclease/exonuclease/phosphatase family metal-dependent hydrolase n=1 Tax=Inquilinus ginsengisoli TaxID=363840 RepID=A0ABU1JQ90_9PROT|nr:endonuclease/exonuclease/phosphatase family protein [Inquilinus ginsengisoli]MDR6290786.1 endonuclease/exonuclease/phosphatase family metal-dependent hydrolase [Inquilinus ginsengisoli]